MDAEIVPDIVAGLIWILGVFLKCAVTLESGVVSCSRRDIVKSEERTHPVGVEVADTERKMCDHLRIFI